MNNLAYLTGKVAVMFHKLTDAERIQAVNAIVQNIPAANTAAIEYDTQNMCCNPNADFAALKADFNNLSDVQKTQLGMNQGWVSYLQTLTGTP
jgi:hypothetical protein